MNTEEIAGGVSPLKKKWKGTASRSGGQKRSIKGKMGGSAGIRNTSKKSGKKRRGGFSKTGAKGSNVHGYGIMTRFKPIVTKDYKGPIAAATTPKTGGGGGGGGGDTYNTSYGDDNSVNNSRTDNSTINVDNQETINNDQAITNKTNTEVIKKDKIKVNQKNKSKSKGGRMTYRDSWDKNSKGVQQKYGTYEEYKKAAIAWNKANPGYQSNESNIDASQNTEINNPVDQSNSGNNKTSGVTINKKSVFEYDPAKRSPNKMKSHAWDMLQKQKKGRGGTSPGKFIGGKLSEQDSSQNFLKQGNFKG